MVCLIFAYRSTIFEKEMKSKERERERTLLSLLEIFVRASTGAKLIDDEKKILSISWRDFAAITKQYPNPI